MKGEKEANIYLFIYLFLLFRERERERERERGERERCIDIIDKERYSLLDKRFLIGCVCRKIRSLKA